MAWWKKVISYTFLFLISLLRELERLQGGESESVGSVEGTVELGGQEHFYWEPHTALVVPGERGELLVHYTTQVTTSLQKTKVDRLFRSLEMSNNKCAWCLASLSTRSPFAAKGPAGDLAAKRGLF